MSVGEPFKDEKISVKEGDVVLLDLNMRPNIVKIKGKRYAVITHSHIIGVTTYHEDLKLTESFFDKVDGLISKN